MPVQHENVLIIFIKNPILGKAKTRIAATEGDETALAIYKELLEYTQKIALQFKGTRFVYYTYFIDETDSWLPRYFTKKLQSEGDLGKRMQTAFEECFAAGAKKVLVIGSDCGDLTPQHLENAIVCLDNKEIVIGPAEDGGYYLMGMTQPHYFIFQNKAWSTAGLRAATIEEIEEKKIDYALLETLNDIDDVNDYKRWKKANSV